MTKVYIRLRRCAHGVVFLRVLCNLILYTEIRGGSRVLQLLHMQQLEFAEKIVIKLKFQLQQHLAVTD